MSLERSFFQEAKWFHSLRKKKKKMYKSGTWRKSVLYHPKTLPLVRACVYRLWMPASVGMLVFMCCVWVHVQLSERTVLEYVGLVFRERLQ